MLGAMTSTLMRLSVRAGLLGGAVGVLACQEPGEGWVPPSTEGTVTNASGGSTSGGPATSDVTSSTASTSGAATATGGADGSSSTSSMTSDGGASSTGGSETTGESTSDSTRTTGSETTGSATTGSATTGSATTGGGGDSLISNGDFSSGEANWSFTGDGTVDTSSGEYCVTSNSGEELQIGWPADEEPASVQSGASYQFSSTDYYSGGTAPTVGVKLGQAQDPYPAFVEAASLSIGSSA